ncbi:hypothetical protein [Dysgonomonas massiliensis]|uniref:hypothetical protein n=1 Tax=Dysgonomonas massiliensis TaxID=2040292 RepID=UPI000C789E77|nr:hypothetical protein [Dysgonomonas massiliensis]
MKKAIFTFIIFIISTCCFSQKKEVIELSIKDEISKGIYYFIINGDDKILGDSITIDIDGLEIIFSKSDFQKKASKWLRRYYYGSDYIVEKIEGDSTHDYLIYNHCNRHAFVTENKKIIKIRLIEKLINCEETKGELE